jgi:hypothetical protein
VVKPLGLVSFGTKSRIARIGRSALIAKGN